MRIVASGDFTADRIRAFEAENVPVDAYGVGSSLIRGANDFTADVVMVDGRPCARSAANTARTATYPGHLGAAHAGHDSIGSVERTTFMPAAS